MFFTFLFFLWICQTSEVQFSFIMRFFLLILERHHLSAASVSVRLRMHGRKRLYWVSNLNVKTPFLPLFAVHQFSVYSDVLYRFNILYKRFSQTYSEWKCCAKTARALGHAHENIVKILSHPWSITLSGMDLLCPGYSKILSGLLQKSYPKLTLLNTIANMWRGSCRISSGDLVFWKGTEGLANLIDLPIHQKWYRSECTNFRSVSLVRLPEKVHATAKALKEDAAKWFYQIWSILSSDFITAATIQTKFSLSRKFVKWEIFGVLLMSTRRIMFVQPLENVPPVPFWKSLVVLWEYGVDGRLSVAVKILYSWPEICVHVRCSHIRSQWALDSNKGACCNHSSSWSLLDRLSELIRCRCHYWQLQDQPFDISWRCSGGKFQLSNTANPSVSNRFFSSAPHL